MIATWVVICEAMADCQVACDLADRVLLEECDWIEHSFLQNYRLYVGLGDGEPFTPWRTVPELARKANIRVHGSFDGERAKMEAKAVRQAILLAIRRSPSGVFLIRDTDGQVDKLQGFHQGRHEMRLPVVVGLAHPNREAWVLAGFEPECQAEIDMLATLRRELGVDPTTNSHTLTAKGDQGKRHAKGVLRRLTNEKSEREQRCWQHTSLATLESRGARNGLANYLSELRERFAPTFGAPPSSRNSPGKLS